MAQRQLRKQSRFSDLQFASSPKRLDAHELLVTYWQFAEGYCVKDGKPTKELRSVREALAPLRDLYASKPTSEFGPKSLQAIRQHMIAQQDLSRKVVNQRIGRIKRMFKWAELNQATLARHVQRALAALTELRGCISDPCSPAPRPGVSEGRERRDGYWRVLFSGPEWRCQHQGRQHQRRPRGPSVLTWGHGTVRLGGRLAEVVPHFTGSVGWRQQGVMGRIGSPPGSRGPSFFLGVCVGGAVPGWWISERMEATIRQKCV
jgi:hypothetical protein